MTRSELHFIIPGSLDQRTGGYIYDARIVEGLRRRGWVVVVHGLTGIFPSGDADARVSLSETLLGIEDGARVVIDGLAMGAMPDVVRAHSERLSVLALVHHRLADETGAKPSERDRLLSLERESLATSLGVIVTSSFTAARVQHMGIEPKSIRTAPPGTDRAPRAKGPAPNTSSRLLCVASVTPRKGQDVLMRALAGLIDIPWTCVCAGSLTRSPDYAHEVLALASDAGLSDRVAFPGECDDDTIDAHYDTCSIFVLPSYFEGYGMVLTEAMARGLPIVSTHGGAIPETMPADAGILVPPGDDIALADAIRTLLVDVPDEPGSAQMRRARLGGAGRRHASGLPTWDDTVDRFSDAVTTLGSIDA